MELQGKKATYDFLSLYNKDSSFPNQDPRPPSQGQWPSPFTARGSGGGSFGSLSASRSHSAPEKKLFMESASRSSKGFDDEEEEEEEEEESGRREASSHKELTVKVDGKITNDNDQKPSTPRSKHSATEQRRRSKINDRFQILRDLIPHTDQKRDKASFLLEVIEYIRFLQERVQKYEPSYLEWNQDNAKLMPWQNNNQSTRDGVSDPSRVIKNDSASPGYMFSGNDNSIPVAPAMLSTAQNLTGLDMAAGVSYKAMETLANFANADNMTTQAQPHWLRSCGPADCAVTILNEQEELTIDEGTISVSSAYSQGLLTTLAQALQSSGIDLSQANISVQINLGKRAINERLAATMTTSNAKDHEDPASTNQAMGHSRVGSNAEQSLQAPKRRKTNNS